MNKFNLKGKLFAAVFDGGANLLTARTELLKLYGDNIPSCVALQLKRMFTTSCLAHLVNGACNSATLVVKSHKFQVRHLPLE